MLCLAKRWTGWGVLELRHLRTCVFATGLAHRPSWSSSRLRCWLLSKIPLERLAKPLLQRHCSFAATSSAPRLAQKRRWPSLLWRQLPMTLPAAPRNRPSLSHSTKHWRASVATCRSLEVRLVVCQGLCDDRARCGCLYGLRHSCGLLWQPGASCAPYMTNYAGKCTTCRKACTGTLQPVCPRC